MWKGALSLVTSFVLDYENGRTPFAMQRITIADFIRRNTAYYVGTSNQKAIAELTEEIQQTGIKYQDARHLACAILAECDYFITTDKRVLKFKSNRIKVINPLDFVVVMEGSQDE